MEIFTLEREAEERKIGSRSRSEFPNCVTPSSIADLARLLIEKGADVALVSRNGNTALKWAKLRGNTALVALLQAKGK